MTSIKQWVSTPSLGRRARVRRVLTFALLVGPSFIVCANCAGAGKAATATPAPSALASALDAQVPALLKRYGIASVGIALVDDGRVVLERAYGEQSAGVPATTSTLFGLASVTKPVSAEVILRLVSAGKLSLDEPIASAFVDPDVANDPRAQVITVRHALAHQSGLPNWRGRSPGGKLAFEFTPGTAYAYSGEGYDYAARFAERKLGKNFEDLAKELVFDPLGMRSTSYSRRSWMSGRLAIPFDKDGHWGEAQVEDSSHWNAGNNLITTPGDYARFLTSVMRGDGLTKDMAAERWQPTAGPNVKFDCKTAPNDCPRSAAQVMGWMRLDYPSGPVFTHTGLNGRPGGERTVAYFDPARKRGVVVFTSGENGVRLYTDVLRILDRGAPVVEYLAAQ